MSKSHNKKRNVGLLYEFLVSVISRSLVDGDKKKSAQALKIIRKHFKRRTDGVINEFRKIPIYGMSPEIPNHDGAGIPIGTGERKPVIRKPNS